MTEAGYDEWLDAVGDGEGYALVCEAGHGSLPPRRVCPHCGSADLAEEPLPEAGTVETYTVVEVATPAFADETPYATAIAGFGSVRLTGVVRTGDLDDLEVGTTVGTDVRRNRATGNRMLVFRPR